MPRTLILYTTVEGQTERIVARVAQALRAKGHDVDVRRAESKRTELDLRAYDGVIIGASIHYGHHLDFLAPLVRGELPALDSRPSAFFSVSLSGGGPGAKPKAAKRYLDKFLRQAGWQPRLSATFGGALQFSKYGPIKRMLMIFVVGINGGDTDTSRDYEYTDWDAVERFAGEFAQLIKPN